MSMQNSAERLSEKKGEKVGGGGEGWRGGKSMSDSYNGVGTCSGANHVLFCPQRPAQDSWGQSGPCSFGPSKQGPGFLQLPQRTEATPRHAQMCLPWKKEPHTLPWVPGGAGRASLCRAFGEKLSRPPCPVGLGAGSEHSL